MRKICDFTRNFKGFCYLKSFKDRTFCWFLPKKDDNLHLKYKKNCLTQENNKNFVCNFGGCAGLVCDFKKRKIFLFHLYKKNLLFGNF